MTKAPMLVALSAIILPACGGEPPADPSPSARVDTVVVTREVAPPLPEGTRTTVCLADGQNIEVRVSPAGDTLVGPRRVRLADLAPAVGFVGDYAADEAWFVDDEPVTFDGRSFSKFGPPQSRDCDAIKVVGDVNGVNLFTDASTAAPFQVLHVPVRPGVFQSYQAQVGRVRG